MIYGPSPDELIAAYVDQAREVPDLVALAGGDPANLVHYEDRSGGDINAAIYALDPPKLLFYLDGISQAPFPSTERVLVKVALRSDNAVELFRALKGGVSTLSGADGLPLLVSTIHPDYTPMALPELIRMSLQVADARFFDVWVFSTSFGNKRIID